MPRYTSLRSDGYGILTQIRLTPKSSLNYFVNFHESEERGRENEEGRKEEGRKRKGGEKKRVRERERKRDCIIYRQAP